jgi:hypothetical protein
MKKEINMNMDTRTRHKHGLGKKDENSKTWMLNRAIDNTFHLISDVLLA